MSVPRDPSGSFKASFDFKSKGLHEVVKGAVCYRRVGWIFGDWLPHEGKWNLQLKVNLASRVLFFKQI